MPADKAAPVVVELEPVPMPNAAEAAAAELGRTKDTEQQPRARRRRRAGKRGGRRTYADLQRENRDLASRVRELGGNRDDDSPRRDETPPPTGPTPEEVTQAQLMCAGIIRFIFNRVAKAKGSDVWAMDEAEAAEIGRDWGKGLAPYLPSFAEAIPFIFGSLKLGLAIDRRERADKAARATHVQHTEVPEHETSPE